MHSTSKVVLIGWQGADWKLIHPLVDSGLMPNLKALIERGVIGNLRPVNSLVHAVAWTTLATGRLPDEHGILSSAELDDLTGAIRRATSKGRRVKALWNIAMQAGMVPNVVDWYASQPAEPLSGACVSEEFFPVQARPAETWPIPPRSVYPENARATLADLRFHPGELTGDDLLPFIPNLAEIDQESDGRVIALAETLARAISTQAVSLYLMESTKWDLTMIRWSAIARASYEFLRYAAPRLPYVSEEDCEKYGAVVKGMYCFHDMLLGRLVHVAGKDATIALVSTEGFRVGAERPLMEGWRERGAAWLRPSGIFCLAGPNIKPEELLHGATVLDIAPTVLAMLGLPAGSDMPGRHLSEVFQSVPDLNRIPSWEDVPGKCGMHPEEREEEKQAARTEIADLEAAGYTEPTHALENAKAVHRERLQSTAVSYLGGNKFAEARSAFRELAKESPQSRFHLWEAYCCLKSGDPLACREVLSNFERKGPFGAMARLISAQAEDDPIAVQRLVRQALALGAEVAFVNYLAASLYIRMKRYKKAETLLRRAIELDPVLQPAHDLLARLLAVRGKRGEAVATALAGLQIDNGSGVSQFTLGMALVFAGENSRALAAFERAAEFGAETAESRAWVDSIRSRRPDLRAS